MDSRISWHRRQCKVSCRSFLKESFVVKIPLVSMANQNDDLGKLLLDGLQLTSVEYEVARRN